jgi:hypothetical protein
MQELEKVPTELKGSATL